jgi:oxygen-dependent protoporphyrinogen oxidase
VKSWIQRQGIPTYLPGHGARLRELHELLSHEEGGSPWAGKLAVAGSGYGGVGVNDCVGSAEGVVRGLERKWKGEGEGEAGKGVTGLERWERWE